MAEPQEILMGDRPTTGPGAYKPPIKESPWATVIAIAAAGEGNYGPLFQLTEQRRKTKIANEIAPVLAQTSNLTNQGKWEEAVKYLSEQSGLLGPRAPEMIPIINTRLQQIQKKQNDWQQLKEITTVYENRLKGVEATGGKIHPAQKINLKVLKDAVKSRSAIGETAVREMISSGKLDIRQITGGTVLVDPMSGLTQFEPTEQFEMPANFNEYVSGNIGQTPTAIANFLNWKPGTGMPAEAASLKLDIGNVPPTPENQAMMRRQVEIYRKQWADFTIAKQVPLDAEISAANLAQGVPPEDIAFRRFGSPGDSKEKSENKMLNALDFIHKRRVVQEKAPIDARLDYPPQMQPTPMNAMNIHTGQYNRTMSTREALNSPDYVVLTEKDSAKASGMFDIANRLRLSAPLLNALPNIDDISARIAFLAQHNLDKVFPINEDMTNIKMMQTLIKDASEYLMNPMGIPASRFQDMTKGVTSDVATKETMLATLEVFIPYFTARFNEWLTGEKGKAMKSFGITEKNIKTKLPGTATPYKPPVVKPKKTPKAPKGTTTSNTGAWIKR